MKIYTCNSAPPHLNFGDRLNGSMMPVIFSDIMQTEDITLMGIGTIINDWSIVETLNENRIWFSSGYGYTKTNLSYKAIGKIYGVRGDISASFLGLDQSLVCGDGAYLLRNFYKPATVKFHKFSFMPHHNSNHLGWYQACNLAGINYIDPTRDVHDIINDINCTGVMLSEAMHGAIVADALRIPWIAVSSNEHIYPLKWVDWLSSLELNYNPEFISTFYQKSKDDFLRKLKYKFSVIRAATELNRITKQIEPILSSDYANDHILDKLHTVSAQIIKDYS